MYTRIIYIYIYIIYMFLSLSLYIYIYICIYILVYICIDTYVYAYTCTCSDDYVHVTCIRPSMMYVAVLLPALRSVFIISNRTISN